MAVEARHLLKMREPPKFVPLESLRKPDDILFTRAEKLYGYFNDPKFLWMLSQWDQDGATIFEIELIDEPRDDRPSSRDNESVVLSIDKNKLVNVLRSDNPSESEILTISNVYARIHIQWHDYTHIDAFSGDIEHFREKWKGYKIRKVRLGDEYDDPSSKKYDFVIQRELSSQDFIISHGNKFDDIYAQLRELSNEYLPEDILHPQDKVGFKNFIPV